MKAKAVVFSALDVIEVRDVELPELEENQILTRSIYTFVSPGTELRTLAGHYGAKKNYPFVPGYAVICRVEKIGSAVKNYKVGDLLCCRAGGKYMDVKAYFGGQSSYHVYQDVAGLHVILPPGSSEEELLPYAVTEVAAISYRGVRMADPRMGDDVLVIGQGMIGRFSAELFRKHGAVVTVCDVDKKRLEEAQRAGFATVDLSEEDADARLASHSPDGFDIVVECSGSTPGVNTAYAQLKNPARDKSYKYIRNLPKLVMQATYIEDVPINPAYFFKAEGAIILTPIDRDFTDRNMVMDMIRNKELDVSDFIKNVFTPDEIVGAYRKLQSHQISSAVFKWS